jgi:mono/diheme cytochrome c family protein
MKCVFIAVLLTAPLLATEPEGSPFAARLSDTGLFRSLQPLEPSQDLISYQINVPFWSDGAEKRRWMLLPSGGKIEFAAHGEWKFPSGSVFVKHFDVRGKPVETRILRFDGTNVTGASYQWQPNGSDARLLRTNRLERVPFQTGEPAQGWYFPSPEDCRTCHNANAGFILGVNTRQLNHCDQLVQLSARGLFDRVITLADLNSFPALPHERLHSSREAAARAWLDVNCAFCHRPRGVVAGFDARYETPLADQNLIGGTVLFNEGIDGARVIAPGDPWRSILLLRVQTLEGLKMPPLAHERLDEEGVATLRSWIESLPGDRSTAPPAIIAHEKEAGTLRISLQHPDSAVTIRYTTNGLPPGKNAPVYSAPFDVAKPVTIRARAFKNGFRQSITAQQTFTD